MIKRPVPTLRNQPLTWSNVVDLLGHYSKRTSWTKRLRRLAEAARGDQPDAIRRQRATVTTLPAPQVAELVDGYRTDVTVNDLAGGFGIHRTTVTRHLLRNGVIMRCRGLDDRQIDHAVYPYQEGLSLVRVGARLNVHAETIRQALHTRGIQMRKPWQRD
jgi:hypothetical protein